MSSVDVIAVQRAPAPRGSAAITVIDRPASPFTSSVASMGGQLKCSIMHAFGLIFAECCSSLIFSVARAGRRKGLDSPFVLNMVAKRLEPP